MLKRTGKNNKKKNLFQDVMYVVALLGPMFIIPQVVLVWTNYPVQGVSILTWGFFGLLSVFWIVDGIREKDKPLLLNAICALILDFLVVLGVLLHR